MDSFAPSTRMDDGAQLVLHVGERALATGNASEAEFMLRDFLVNMIRAAAQDRPATPGTYSQATNFALRLARATGNGEWFDYAIEMLRLRQVACTDEFAERLRSVLDAVDSVTITHLEDYAEWLRSSGASLEKLRASKAVDALLREARRKPWVPQK